MIASFRAHYAPPRPSALALGRGEDVPLTAAGLRLLGSPPATGVLTGFPPRRWGEPSNRYLWVIDDRGIPYIQEVPVLILGNKVPKHTNLTAGGLAYIGGELWFSSYESLYVSGASGRYPPQDAQHLADAVKVFESFGFQATSLGWASDNDEAERYWKL